MWRRTLTHRKAGVRGRGVGMRETETCWRDDWGTQSLPFPRLPQLPDSSCVNHFLPFIATRGATQTPCRKLTHLGVVPVPPHVSQGAHLAGPQHGGCIDLFVLSGDKGKRQVYMLQGTWGTRGERRMGREELFLLCLPCSESTILLEASEIPVVLPEGSAQVPPLLWGKGIYWEQLCLHPFHLQIFLPGLNPELFLCKSLKSYK